MPRPKKCRKVCQMPQTRAFLPAGEVSPEETVILTVDEYEAIRLIDKEGFSQEECSAYMQVARTTVQLIYNSARKKLAEVLVDGLPLRIEGGDYQLCDGREKDCGCGGCRKHRRSCRKMTVKEGKGMKIAIPLDENKQDVCIVLSRAPYFLFHEDGNGYDFRKSGCPGPERRRNTGCPVPGRQQCGCADYRPLRGKCGRGSESRRDEDL